MALTINEVTDRLKQCTIDEVIEVCNFKDTEDLLLSLEDFIDENLEDMSESLEVMGLV